MKQLKTVLLTGAGGLIGLETTKQLLKRNYRVIAIDNFINSSLNDFPEHKNLQLYVKDIRNIRAMKRIFSLHPEISSVIHLAALHYIPYCDAHPHEAFEVNVKGTQNIVEAMIQYGVKQILFSSTAAVYKPKNTPHEEKDVIAPIDIYGDTKYMCEELIQRAAEGKKLSYTILRLFNVYGYGDANPHLIPDLLDQVIKTNQVHIGNPSSLRDYISKHDVARAFIMALESEKAGNKIYNVGHETPFSAKDIFEMLADFCRLHHNQELTLQVNSQSQLRKVDRPLLVSNTKKIRFELEWAPQFTLQEFLENWVKEDYVQA